MDDYGFYVGYLRFVAAKTPRDSSLVDGMMQVLQRIAAEIEEGGGFYAATDQLVPLARALAGVAGLLQQKILPEVVADQNQRVEAQIRWAIDTSMTLMANLTVADDTGDHDPATPFSLPPPPLLPPAIPAK